MNVVYCFLVPDFHEDMSMLVVDLENPCFLNCCLIHNIPSKLYCFSMDDPHPWLVDKGVSSVSESDMVCPLATP